jgi:hypothetical protein
MLVWIYTQGHLHVRRLKNGRPSVHTVRGSELRALRRLQREQDPPSPYLFTTERRTPMSAAARTAIPLSSGPLHGAPPLIA